MYGAVLSQERHRAQSQTITGAPSGARCGCRPMACTRGSRGG